MMRDHHLVIFFLLGLLAMAAAETHPKRIRRRRRELVKVELQPEDLFAKGNEFGEEEERALQEEEAILAALQVRGLQGSMEAAAEAEPATTEEETVDEALMDLDWADLPEEGKAAATTLGYDEGAWNGGADVATSDSAWDDLSPEEMEAAETLGYNQVSWDEGRRRKSGLAKMLAKYTARAGAIFD